MIVESRTGKVNKYKCIILILSNILLIITQIELFLAIQFLNPKFSPFFLRDFVKETYQTSIRNIIQYEPACAQYDPILFYTLKPGTCKFSNIEFLNDYHINRLGLRDTDESLTAPEIIILGDSYAMGWGVDQDQTYAKSLEKTSNKKVLNAGISSYGTVREMMMLDRLDTSKMKYLVIHYISNDFDENSSYSKNKKFKAKSNQEYEQIKREYFNQKRYFPGKYIVLLINYYQKTILNISAHATDIQIEEVTDNAQNEVDYYINSLLNVSHINFHNKILIIIGDDYFINLLKEKKLQIISNGNLKDIRFIDLQNTLDFKSYYDIDDHLNARGHEMLAKELMHLINQDIQK